jgi:hypothetical protein
MTNAVAIFSPLDRVTDDDGNPVSGALINVYAVGTTSPLDVYSDQVLSTVLPNPVVCNSVGQPTSDGSATCIVYVGTSSYKLVVTDAEGALIPGMSYDAIRGADEIPTAADSGLPTTPVVNQTMSRAILSTDQGKLINASGASTVLTLPDAGAEAIGDAWRVGVKHDDATAGRSVAIRTTGGQTITHPGQASATSVALTGLGETMWFVSDGSDWHVDTYVPQLIHGTTGIIPIADRLTAPPASPTGGACYIINGTPTGAWATLSFVENQIVRSDGNGSWVSYTPTAGWLAYVVDEDLYSKWDGSAWSDLMGMEAAQSSTLECAVFQHQVSNGTVGGTATAAAWTTRTLNTEVKNTITGCSLASSQITLPVGTYHFNFWQAFHRAEEAQMRIAIISGTATPSDGIVGGRANYGQQADSGGDTVAMYFGAPPGSGVLTVTAEAVVELQYYVAASAGGTSGLGSPSAAVSTEVYAGVTILSLTALQGATGAQGAQGVAGAGYGGASTTSLAIGTGAKTFTMDASGYAYVVGSRVRAASDASPTVNWMEGYVTSYSGTSLEITVDSIGGSGTLADWSFSIAGIVPDTLINDMDGGGYSITNVLADNGTITSSGALTDAMSGTVQIVNSGSNVTLTMPNSLEVGWTCTFVQIGAGQAIFAAGSGATINNRQGDDRTHSQWAMAVLTVVTNSGGSSAVAVLGGDTA